MQVQALVERKKEAELVNEPQRALADLLVELQLTVLQSALMSTAPVPVLVPLPLSPTVSVLDFFPGTVNVTVSVRVSVKAYAYFLWPTRDSAISGASMSIRTGFSGSPRQYTKDLPYPTVTFPPKFKKKTKRQPTSIAADLSTSSGKRKGVWWCSE